MSTPTEDSRAQLRRSVYLLLIAVATGALLGRILAVDSVDKAALQTYREDIAREKVEAERREARQSGLSGQDLRRRLASLDRREQELLARSRLRRPFLSGNDRSRWCTVRALVEEEMRVDGAPYAIDKVIQEPRWDTIDMVKHDGHVYSSKPPLFPTLMAAEYWLIRRLTGMSLGTDPYYVGRLMLLSINVIPLLVYFLLLASLVERLGTTDWGRLFVMAAATLGTFLTTFAVVINNHLPAAVSLAVVLYAAVRIWFDQRRQWWYFAIAGGFAAFAAANELPAASLLAALGAALLWKAPRPTLVAFVPAALLVAVAFFGTNWIAHHSLRPPYMHRGKASKTIDDATATQADVPADSPTEKDPDDWYDYTYVRNGKQYQSYWTGRVGIDRGEPSRAAYALHVLLGHHGIFSLTPVWILSAVGMFLWLPHRQDRRLRELALLVGAVTLVCLVFYLSRPQVDRNYGGMTSGFRWMFWFAPLWLLTMLPAVDAMARKGWLRLVALVLLAVSVLSASYPTWNPWTHPWLMDWLYYLGWV